MDEKQHLSHPKHILYIIQKGLSRILLKKYNSIQNKVQFYNINLNTKLNVLFIKYLKHSMCKCLL